MTLRWSYAVTFESTSQPPETVRGEVQGSLSAAIGRAVRRAKRQKPTRNHYRGVVVQVARLDPAGQSAEEPPAAAAEPASGGVG